MNIAQIIDNTVTLSFDVITGQQVEFDQSQLNQVIEQEPLSIPEQKRQFILKNQKSITKLLKVCNFNKQDQQKFSVQVKKQLSFELDKMLGHRVLVIISSFTDTGNDIMERVIDEVNRPLYYEQDQEDEEQEEDKAEKI